MNVSDYGEYEIKYLPKNMNIVDNSSNNIIELNPNENIHKNRYGDDFKEDDNVNKETLLNEKQFLNINSLQSIRISYSLENSKDSESFIEVIDEGKIMNINNYEEKNENDMNICNRDNNKIDKKIENILEQKNNNSRNKNPKIFQSTNTNNKENNNNIYNIFQIGEIFKERFEEKTKSYKISNQKESRLKNNNDIFINKATKPKTLQNLNNYKKNYISKTNKQNTNKKQNQLKINDSLSIDQDNIDLKELKENKNKKLIIETFDIKNLHDNYGKNVLISDLDLDLSNTIKGENKKNNKGKISNKTIIEKDGKKQFDGNNKKQKTIKTKYNFIVKKIYPIRKIKLANNNSKQNILQLKQREYKEKNLNDLNINNYKHIHPSSSTKIHKRITQKNTENKQNSSYSNISSYRIINTWTNTNPKSINKKATMHSIQRKFSYKPKHLNKSPFNEKNINLKKYYRITPSNKITINNDLFNNIKNIIINNRNKNEYNKIVNRTLLNNHINKDNTTNKNLIKKNNMPLNKRTNNSYYNNKNYKSNMDLPKSYCNKNNAKNKIPIKKNLVMINPKKKLIRNNNNIGIKIHSANSSIVHSNSYYGKKERDYFKLNKNGYNYYNLKKNQNNKSGFFIFDGENKNNKKNYINAIYNSFTKNIYAIPPKTKISNIKTDIFYSKNKDINHSDNPLILKTNIYKHDKNGIHSSYRNISKKSINNNKSKDNFNSLTELESKNNNRTFNHSNKRNRENKIPRNISNDKLKIRNYARNTSNNSLIYNHFMTKDNKNNCFLTTKSSKIKLVINGNKKSLSTRNIKNSQKKQ